jgi:alpha-beta hydrolase superfamily lysophospholipase
MLNEPSLNVHAAIYTQAGHGRTALPPTTEDLEKDAEAFPEAVAQVMQALLQPDEQAFMWGNSLGGLVSVKVAQRLPDRIAGIVLAR